jgi:malate dehydrogenase (oxaloacetate-decarboxylating)(NADP+)
MYVPVPPHRPLGSDETLFYRTVMSDAPRFTPILYDPTVADACLAFGHIYRSARGMYIGRDMKGRIDEVLPTGRIATCIAASSRPGGMADTHAFGPCIV